MSTLQPTVIDGVVYIGSGDSYFYALNEADGEMLWRFKTGARVSYDRRSG